MHIVIIQEIPDQGSAWVFDSTNPNWCSIPHMNYFFLKAQQNFMNNLLQTRGHVFLNEVYDALGLPRTPIGALMGWTTETYVDFGIDYGKNVDLNLFDSIQLKFNVQDIIFNKI